MISRVNGTRRSESNKQERRSNQQVSQKKSTAFGQLLEREQEQEQSKGQENDREANKRHP